MLTRPTTSSQPRVAQLRPLQSLLVEAVDHMGAGDHWSLQDRTDALLALRLTDHAFCAQASAPWRKTWQDKVAASGTEEQIRPAYLQHLNGPNLRRATRNPFLDAVWNRAPELRVGSLAAGGAQVLRYAAGLASPPKSLVFDAFATAFLIDLGRWPVLTRLSIKDVSLEYRSADEADSSFFQSLFYKHDLEGVEVYETPHDYTRFFGGVESSSVTCFLAEALTFHQFAPTASTALPNLRQLTLLINEHDLYQTFDDTRIAQSIGTVVVEQLTLRWQANLSGAWRSPFEEQDLVLPVIPRDHIKQLVFDGFPQDQLKNLIARSPRQALAYVPSVLIQPYRGDLEG